MSTTRRADPFGVAALAAAGTMAAHEVGYLADRGHVGVSHAYFGVLGPIVVLAVSVAAWIGAIRLLRRDPGRAPSLGMLTAIQIGVFVAMEIGERLAAGTPATSMASVPVLLGLAAQPVTAWLALRLLDAGRRLIEAIFLDEPHVIASDTRTLPPSRQRVLVDSLVGTRLHLRGPPVV